MKTKGLDLGKVIEGYMLSCRAEGKSPRTVEWYFSFLARFTRFLAGAGMSTDVAGIGKQQVRAFILHLQSEARVPRSGAALSPATVQGYARTIKAFFSWAVREGHIEVSPMNGMPLPKVPVKVVNTLSGEQVGRLAQACHGCNGTGQRNLAMVLLMLDCGVRVSELTGIELNDVNLAEGCIKITAGKGSRQRLVPVGTMVQRHLWRYIHCSRPQPLGGAGGRLFLDEGGLPLTRNGVQQVMRRCGRRAGIQGVRCSPHTLRHTFAKNYLLNGGDIFSLQKILGHSSLASVRMYLNLFAVDVKHQHRKFSPVDTMAADPHLRAIPRPALPPRQTGGG